DLTWGNYEAYIEIIQQMLRHEGFGAALAKGPKEAAKELGHGAEDMLAHIQGEGPMQHDIRGNPGIFWTVLTGSMVGIGATMGGYMNLAPPEELGLPRVNWERIEESLPVMGAYAWKTCAKKFWDDCHGTCFFSTVWVPGALGYSVRAVAAAVGWDDFTNDEAMRVGERIATLTRLMSLSRGYTPDQDLDIGPRLLEPQPDGPRPGASLAPYIQRPRVDFYTEAGWDLNTGQPKPEALRRLGLANYKVGKGR
ncbi:MAG TPA: aldehyde ferredoxin oxidoreductase C-terminal domain-containing protein, partial [Dehalococcoidia bacterium]|nr:aldehyde ferredoxin oxidoreductase C-terminal domain-containing protein [Dehalococcoidia bacterium]